MTVDEKTPEISFGAVVTPPDGVPATIAKPAPAAAPAPQRPAQPTLRTSLSFEKTPLSPITSEVGSNATSPKLSYEDGGNSNPYSAFYNHDLCSTTSKVDKNRLCVGRPSADLEAGTPISTTTTLHQTRSSVDVDGRVKECTMWPSKQTLMDAEKRRKREQARQNCCLARNPLRDLNKRQKLWTKIAIALFIVACAVGLGIGISKAVGAGVWAGKGQSREIGSPHIRI